MQHDFWHERWQAGRIAFHEPRGNVRLEEQWAATKVAPSGRVLVTLCGKSLDMMWLAASGYEVLGVELSAIAARDFFVENALPFAIEERGPFVAYRSTRDDRDITILVGDFFTLDAAMLGEVVAVYDRAATIALPDDLRQRYVRHLAVLLPPETRMLLIAIEYDETAMNGPPFSVPDAMVRSLYGPDFTVDLAGEMSGPEVAGPLRDRGLQTLTERAYRLERRSQ